MHREPSESQIAFYDIAFWVVQHRIRDISLVEISHQILPNSKERKNRHHFLMGSVKVLEEQVRLEMLLCSFSENTMCLRGPAQRKLFLHTGGPPRCPGVTYNAIHLVNT